MNSKCTGFIIAVILIFSTNLTSQNFVDALRYSNADVLGTARTVGVGGSLGALGTDFAVMSTNPAGIGMNRRSEFNITPTFVNTNVATVLTTGGGNGEQTENDANVLLNNLGVIIHSEPRSLKWKTMNLAIGFNKVADFNQSTLFNGRSQGSITDRFVDIANRDNFLNDFETGPAFDASAIYFPEDATDDLYHTDFEFNPRAVLFREQTIVEEGSLNELVFGFGANYDEKVLVGLTLGVPFVSFRQEKVYTEEDEGTGPDGDVLFFDNLSYTERLTTTGSGINLKAGLIFRFNQMIRAGVAVHTPTYFTFEDNFTTDMEYTFTDVNGSSTGLGQSPEGIFNYNLTTPWRFIGSAGILLQGIGFISGEVEYLNFASAKISFDEFAEDAEDINQEIEGQLSSALRVRLGGEFVYKQLRFRAGVGLKQAPFTDDDAFDYNFSGGIGVRLKGFYADLAYRFDDRQETYLPYVSIASPDEDQVVSVNARRSMALLTVGVNF